MKLKMQLRDRNDDIVDEWLIDTINGREAVMKQVQEAVSEITILMADAFADDQPEDATKYEDPPEDDFEDDEDDEDLEDEEE